jgi:Sulfatase
MSANVTRRNLLWMAANGGAAFAVSGTADNSTAQTIERRPNIVFILADDMGYADISCYGRRDFTTANIDRIASQGTRFTQAYANFAGVHLPLARDRFQRLGDGLTQLAQPPAPAAKASGRSRHDYPLARQMRGERLARRAVEEPTGRPAHAARRDSASAN